MTVSLLQPMLPIRDLPALGERNPRDRARRNAETIAGVAAFTFARESAFGN